MFEMLMNKDAMKLIDQVQEPFRSLPHLPHGLVEFFVKITPWLALLGAIGSLLGGPLVGIFGSLASIMTLSPTFMVWTVATVVLTLVNAALLFMAFSPLRERALKGWVFLFWSNIINVGQNLLGLILGANNFSFVGTIIGAVIGLYVLFEMRSFYDGVRMGEVVKNRK